MSRRYLAILLTLIALAACSVPTADTLPSATPEAEPAATLGPVAEDAAAFCEEMGGDIKMIDEGEREIAYCVFEDGRVCGALEMFLEPDACPMEIGGGEQPTATSTPLPSPTPWAFPTPAWDVEFKWPYGLPDPVPAVEATFLGDYRVYVLLGSDWMAHRGDQDLTDAVAIVIKHPDATSASVISVPRDLYVYIPGYGMGRINQAWGLGRFQAIRDTVRYNFGLDVDGVIYGRIYALQRFIDDGLGGVEVYVRSPVVETCGDVYVNAVEGRYFMNGATAMCFARGRGQSSDYQRMERQQDLLLAMLKKFIAKAAGDPISFGEALYDAYVDAGVATDIGFLQAPGLIWQAVGTEEISTYRIVPPYVEHFDHPETGAWLLQPPDQLAVHQMMLLAIDGEDWNPEAILGPETP